jgi:hypothetical protein
MAVKKAHRPKKDAEHPLRSVTRDPTRGSAFYFAKPLTNSTRLRSAIPDGPFAIHGF